MVTENALHICSQLLKVTLRRLQRWHISAGENDIREQEWKKRSDSVFILVSCCSRLAAAVAITDIGDGGTGGGVGIVGLVVVILVVVFLFGGLNLSR
jgi:hypothetical protein